MATDKKVTKSLENGKDYYKATFISVLKENNLSYSPQAVSRHEARGWVEKPRRDKRGWRVYSKQEIFDNMDFIRQKRKDGEIRSRR